jgi:hypothetical protein
MEPRGRPAAAPALAARQVARWRGAATSHARRAAIACPSTTRSTFCAHIAEKVERIAQATLSTIVRCKGAGPCERQREIPRRRGRRPVLPAHERAHLTACANTGATLSGEPAWHPNTQRPVIDRADAVVGSALKGHSGRPEVLPTVIRP